MEKVVDFRQPVSEELVIDEELAEMIKDRTTRNVWELKKEAVLEVIEKQYLPTRVKEAQRKAVDELFDFVRSAVLSGVPFNIIHRVADKKSLLLADAKTVEEVEEIMRLSVSHFEDNGLVVTGKYHIPEEELMLLGVASRMGKLTKRAQERFVYLYEWCFGKRKGEQDE